jgi:hypothetical protein
MICHSIPIDIFNETDPLGFHLEVMPIELSVFIMIDRDRGRELLVSRHEDFCKKIRAIIHRPEREIIIQPIGVIANIEDGSTTAMSFNDEGPAFVVKRETDWVLNERLAGEEFNFKILGRSQLL